MTKFSSIPIVLLILLLLSAILLLLALPPAKAPPFEGLTQLTCDSFPVMPAVRANAAAGLRMTYTCRAANGIVRKVTGFPGGTNAGNFTACRRGGGIVKLWLNPSPSPYGPYVFQASCQDEIFLSYPVAASTYESRRAFSQLSAWVLLVLTAGALGLMALRTSPHRRH